MRNEQRSPWFYGSGGGGGVRSDRNLDNNSESFDKHVSPLIVFYWLLCFGAILQFLIFDPVIV